MGGFFGGIFAGTMLIWMVLSMALLPLLAFGNWLEKRDCELIHQTECSIQMLPVTKEDF